MGETAGAGTALRAAFQARGCVLDADEARALAVALRDLIASGLIGPDPLSSTQLAIGHVHEHPSPHRKVAMPLPHNMGSPSYISKGGFR